MYLASPWWDLRPCYLDRCALADLERWWNISPVETRREKWKISIFWCLGSQNVYREVAGNEFASATQRCISHFGWDPPKFIIPTSQDTVEWKATDRCDHILVKQWVPTSLCRELRSWFYHPTAQVQRERHELAAAGLPKTVGCMDSKSAVNVMEKRRHNKMS